MSSSGAARDRSARLVQRLPGSIIAITSVLVALFGFTTWLVISNPGSNDSTLTGWGVIGGVDGVSGQNINEVISSLDGIGSYRPALLPTALAALAFIVGLRLIFARSRIAAAAAVACGGFIAIWGGYRGLVPGDVAGILTGDEYRGGIGAWLVLVAGLAIVATATVVLVKRPVQTSPAPRTRGIQHPR
jgi:hypothetical protein